jgi:hypothetical protein
MAANIALEQEHLDSRIDHRTLQAQGIDREPKPHIPRAAFEMERHGYRSVVAERIRAEYQARVEARLQRAAHHEQSTAAPESPERIAVQKWLQYRQAHEEQPKSQEQVAKESVQKWLQYRQAQEAQERGQQTEPAPASRSTQAKDHGHSL